MRNPLLLACTAAYPVCTSLCHLLPLLQPVLLLQLPASFSILTCPPPHALHQGFLCPPHPHPEPRVLPPSDPARAAHPTRVAVVCLPEQLVATPTPALPRHTRLPFPPLPIRTRGCLPAADQLPQKAAETTGECPPRCPHVSTRYPASSATALAAATFPLRGDAFLATRAR